MTIPAGGQLCFPSTQHHLEQSPDISTHPGAPFPLFCSPLTSQRPQTELSAITPTPRAHGEARMSPTSPAPAPAERYS